MELDESRRNILKGGLAAITLGAVPDFTVLAQAVPQTTRLEWADFRWHNNGADYNALIKGIQTMKANTNASDPGSWAYWANVHKAHCPHGMSYFLCWHRGYMYYFEQALRTASGNSNWSLPYWDYYQHPTMPPQFYNDPSNPLYVSNRVNTNVYQALTLAPFSDQILNFQRGTTNAYEPTQESAPHNPVHNIIGGYMADMLSPLDPIFWLHHGSIDRMWAAWVAAGNGRTMPDLTSYYWKGTQVYDTNLTMATNQTYSTTGLNYTYPDLTMPSKIPPNSMAKPHTRGRIMLAQWNGDGRSVVRPLNGNFTLTAPRNTDSNRRSLGGAKNVVLDDTSVSARIPLQSNESQQLQATLEAHVKLPKGATKQPYNAVKVVLDGLQLTDAGKKGGFFYNIYLNLPPSISATAAEQKYLLGSIGAYEIAVASHHGMAPKMEFDVTQQLIGLPPSSLKDVTVSLVRVSGDVSPRGPVIQLGEVRLELSNDNQ